MQQNPEQRTGRRKRAREPQPVAAAAATKAPIETLNAPVNERLRMVRENDNDLDSDPMTQFLTTLVADMQLADAWYGELSSLEKQTPQLLSTTAQLLKKLQRKERSSWVRHTRLRDIVSPVSPDEVRETLRISWVLVCRLRIMCRQAEDMLREKRVYEEWPSELLQEASAFHMVKTIGRYHSPVALSNDSIGTYSLRVLIKAMDVLCEALDTYGWTPSAGAYLQALFMRYALAVHLPEEWADNDEYSDLGQWVGALPPPGAAAANEDDEETMPEEEAETDVVRAYEDVFEHPLPPAEPCLFPARVNTAFLEVGERLFFHHLWRNHSLHELYTARWLTRPFSVTLQQARATWRLNVGLPALHKVLMSLLKDDLLGDMMHSALVGSYPGRLLLPGEMEQMQFLYASEGNSRDPYTVLFRLRFDKYKHMQRTVHFDSDHKSDPVMFLSDYVAQEKAVARYLLEQPAPPPLPPLPPHPPPLPAPPVPVNNNNEMDAMDIDDPPPAPPPAQTTPYYVPNKIVDVTEGQWLDETLLRNRLGSDHERLLLLWFELTFDKSMRGDANVTSGEHTVYFAANAYADDRESKGPKARPPHDRAHFLKFCAEREDWPKFMAVWYNYSVGPLVPNAATDPTADNNQEYRSTIEAFTTPHLVEALGAWLCLARERERVSGEILKQAVFCKRREWRDLTMPRSLLFV